jgi:CHAD domain-containing protein
VKPLRIDLQGVSNMPEVVDRVVRMRVSEVRHLAVGLERRDKQGLHDFRIACKRLRYALERFLPLDSTLQPAAERFARLQDALGGARDRDVLLTILPPTMAQTQRRLQEERQSCIDRAAELWAQFAQANDSHHF